MTSINDNVVIGIFTQPSDSDYVDYPASQYSYLAASYVKFVEMAGARVVPIPYEANNTVLEQYFMGINGFIIPGGASELDTPTGPSKFTKAVAYMINRAL
jgi:gamma-glutamyl hydrolase